MTTNTPEQEGFRPNVPGDLDVDELAVLDDVVRGIVFDLPVVSTVLPEWPAERVGALRGLPLDQLGNELGRMLADLDALIASQAEPRD